MSRYPAYLPRLMLFATLAAGVATSGAENTSFSSRHGGYSVSTDFSVDRNNHAVISLPADVRAGDLLSIRPLRLNNDEYLILQRCYSPDCAQATVIRAWNAAGHMGPDLVTSNKIPIKPGTTYMLWMQRISTQGGRSFSLYQKMSPPLVFIPAGSAQLFADSDLAEARKRGPERVDRSSKGDGEFIAKFAGGSVVRMKLLRPVSHFDGM